MAVENCVLGHCTFREALIFKAAKRISENLCGHSERDRTSLVSICGVTGLAVAFTAFILRMISKAPYFGGQFHADDWTITVAMVFGIPLGVLSVPLANAGLGKDMWNVQFDKITYILKVYYVQEVMYFVTMNVTKVSILFFYLRIFPSHKFKIACYVVMSVTIAYGTALVFAALFQCNPVHLAWEHWDGEHTNYKCSNINLIGWLSAAINIVLDIVIITLPVKQLLGLSLSVKKKIHILLMFGVGFFVTIVSIIRLKSLLQFGNSHNITWDHVPVGYWSTIEGHASILCACMPAIRALLRKLFPAMFGDRTGASSSGTRKIRTNKLSSSNVKIFSSQGHVPHSPLSPRSPHARNSLGKGGGTVSLESDIFPLVERGEVGPGHGFGSYTIVKSVYEN
ncbi:CFEM domain-containing protein [Blastomyces dermatitidis ER-3]|nr:CFEM domain-containing protein [Blastomyces dermatitidis ER-3]EEQ87665.1 CFEM domain-containing protein [Blastomyces dermatitidis ER-3]